MSIKAKSHPKHYLMHKYWGRKPHNVVSHYIQKYSKQGDTVLDPFLGSGGLVIEANKIKRKSIGIDLNPMSIFITNNTLSDINLDDFNRTFLTILESIPQEVKDLYSTNINGKKCTIDNAIWSNEKLVKIKSLYKKDKFITEPSLEDLLMVDKAKILLDKYSKEMNLFYPKDKMLKYVKRSGKTHINELFSNKNLLTCALLLNSILKIEDQNLRELFKMVFTSMLPNVSKMIPGDINRVTGKSGWQITKFWVPKIHTEKNPLQAFSLRFKKIYSAKEEIMSIKTDTSYHLYMKSSDDLSFLESDSIDYIFTDPPYGESVAYFGLSMFWNSWISKDIDYENEIIYDPYRKKDYQDYESRLKKVFKECYRLLKNEKFISFTFNNRKLIFWKIIIDCCLNAGFILKKVEWQEQAVSSGTQGINRKNTLKGDFVYTFQKVEYETPDMEDIDGTKEIIKKMKSIFRKTSFVSASRLYELLIPFIVNNRYFLNEDGKLLDLENLISKYFHFGPVIIDDGVDYGWHK